ncbi:ABC transporter ATP-binding protein [Tistrella bauzanensis]|uniref:ABC transporter ATP-binding protein n=1 Tax=Tistrella TaxID=171436 RepID=UPI0031F663D1
MREAAALGLEHVTVHLGGRPVLHDLSLDLVPGEMLALVGPNGSGKTTALRVMAGALEPATGRVLLDDAPLADRARRMRARDVAYLPQGFRSHWNLTVAELIRLGRERGAGWLPGGAGAGVRGRPVPPPAALDLDRLLTRRLDDLSGGERARAALAWALAAPARLLLADEPTASLDIAHALAVMRLLASLRGAMTVVVVVHDLGLALAHADRVAVLDGGRLRAVGTPRAVLASGAADDAFGLSFRPVATPSGTWPVAVAPGPAGEAMADGA